MRSRWQIPSSESRNWREREARRPRIRSRRGIVNVPFVELEGPHIDAMAIIFIFLPVCHILLLFKLEMLEQEYRGILYVVLRL